MKELVIGSNGFVGQHVYHTLARDNRNAHRASRLPDARPNGHAIDLEDQESINRVLETVRPEIIINCAVISDARQGGDVTRNKVMTGNLLNVVAENRLVRAGLKRVVVIGSGAEYGPVNPTLLPAHEDLPLGATGGYALSKRQEVETALQLANQHNLPVAVARLLNQIGPGMHRTNLLGRILDQIDGIKAGTQEPQITLHKLGDRRDYIDVRDSAAAIRDLGRADKLNHQVYNVGSGQPTTNEELAAVALLCSDLSSQDVPIVGTNAEPPVYLGASWASIDRISTELGWQPAYTLGDTVAELVAERAA